jgi:hypothetical protein
MAMILVEILRLTLTNFQFMIINMEYFNVITVALRVILPLGLWTLANWGFTTLAVMIVLSQVITAQEGAIYYVLISFSVAWSVLLVLAAMMMIHDYSPAKAVLSSLLTIVGVGVMVFIFLLFFSLISDAIAYFISLFKEIVFRLT